MNNTTIVGRLTREIEVKTAGKTVVVNNTVAVNNGKDKEATFIPIVAWGKTAELLSKYFHKGDGIGIEGRLQSRSYETKDGQKRTVLEVVVNTVNFLPTNKGDGGAAPAAAAAAPAEEDDLF